MDVVAEGTRELCLVALQGFDDPVRAGLAYDFATRQIVGDGEPLLAAGTFEFTFDLT